MSGYIDCHNHLQDLTFDQDRQEIVKLAIKQGVQYSVVNATQPSDWAQVKQLSEDYTHIIPCFGLHPWFISNVQGQAWKSELSDLLTSSRSGVGEFGLDRWKKDLPQEQQIQAFRFQWALAIDLHRPAMIHCLKAWGLFMEQIRTLPPHPNRFMLHGFGGPTDLIGPLAQAGAYFSIAGNILDPRRTRAQQALLQIPLERLLIETDAPDMTPPPAYCLDLRTEPNGRNQPANLPLIIAGLATLRGDSEKTIARAVYNNSQRFLEDLLP